MPARTSRLRPLLLVGALLVTVGAARLVLTHSDSDGLERYPHTYIAQPGYDLAALQTVEGPLAEPPPPPAGLHPAWQADDPAFDDGAGRHWLFPLEPGAATPVPPLHPTLRQRPALDRCSPVRTAEGQRQLAAYSAAYKP